MAGLGLRLARGDKLVINGAAIHFVTPAEIRLANRARFLFGRQIMAPNEADTPARRIYFALQTAYVGEPDEREAALLDARLWIGMFRDETTSPTARDLLDAALEAARKGDHHRALRIARRIIRHEEAVLDPSGPPHEPAQPHPASRPQPCRSQPCRSQPCRSQPSRSEPFEPPHPPEPHRP